MLTDDFVNFIRSRKHAAVDTYLTKRYLTKNDRQFINENIRDVNSLDDIKRNIDREITNLKRDYTAKELKRIYGEYGSIKLRKSIFDRKYRIVPGQAEAAKYLEEYIKNVIQEDRFNDLNELGEFLEELNNLPEKTKKEFLKNYLIGKPLLLDETKLEGQLNDIPIEVYRNAASLDQEVKEYIRQQFTELVNDYPGLLKFAKIPSFSDVITEVVKKYLPDKTYEFTTVHESDIDKKGERRLRYIVKAKMIDDAIEEYKKYIEKHGGAGFSLNPEFWTVKLINNKTNEPSKGGGTQRLLHPDSKEAFSSSIGDCLRTSCLEAYGQDIGPIYDIPKALTVLKEAVFVDSCCHFPYFKTTNFKGVLNYIYINNNHAQAIPASLWYKTAEKRKVVNNVSEKLEKYYDSLKIIRKIKYSKFNDNIYINSFDVLKNEIWKTYTNTEQKTDLTEVFNELQKNIINHFYPLGYNTRFNICTTKRSINKSCFAYDMKKSYLLSLFYFLKLYNYNVPVWYNVPKRTGNPQPNDLCLFYSYNYSLGGYMMYKDLNESGCNKRCVPPPLEGSNDLKIYEYYKFDKYIDLTDKKELIENIKNVDYKKLFGMMIGTHSQGKVLSLDDESFNERFCSCRYYKYSPLNSILHPYLAIGKTMILVKEIESIYTKYKIWPLTVVTDELIYSKEVSTSSYFRRKEITENKINYVNNYKHEYNYVELYKYSIGCAGSGKSTFWRNKIINNELHNPCCISNNYRLVKSWSKYCPSFCYQYMIKDFNNYYSFDSIIVDEIYNFEYRDVSNMFNIANRVNYFVLIGDPFQLCFNNNIQELNYTFNFSRYRKINYRNDINTKLFVDAVKRGYFEEKDKEYILQIANEFKEQGKLIIDKTRKNKKLRFTFKEEKEYNKGLQTDYWRCEQTVKIDNKYYIAGKLYKFNNLRTLQRRGRATNVAPRMLHPKHFINTNCLKFCATQGQSLECVEVFGEYDDVINKLMHDCRKMYVLLSRIITKNNPVISRVWSKSFVDLII